MNQLSIFIISAAALLGNGAAFAKEATAGGSKAFRDFGAETHRIVQRHIGAIRAVPAK